MSELVTNKNESVQNIYDKLVSLKKEAFSNLDQALNVDGVANTNENIDSAIILYEKCLVLIDNAIEYFNQNKSKLAQLEGNSTFEFISFIFNLNQFFFLNFRRKQNEYSFGHDAISNHRTTKCTKIKKT